MKERIGKVLKNKRLILTILIGIAFTISISYAIYNIVLQGQKPHQITTSKLSFSYKEPLEALNLLVSKALTDEEGKAQDNYYEFTVKAESDTEEIIDYVIYLQSLESEKSYSTSDIKVYLTSVLNEVETEVLEPITINNLSQFNNIADTGALYGSNFTFTSSDLEVKQTTYRLRIWLKEGFDFSNYITSSTTNGEQNIKLDSYEYKFRVNVATGEMPENVAPTLTIIDSISDDSKNPTITSNSSYTISGTATDESGIKSVKVNGTAVTVNSDGTWSTSVGLTEGTTKEITVIATDNGDVTTTLKLYVMYDGNSPTLTVTSPTSTDSSNPTISTTASYTVSGSATDASGIKSVTINGTSVMVSSNGSFSKDITLENGSTKTITIVATDKAGNTTTETRYVRYNNVSYVYEAGYTEWKNVSEVNNPNLTVTFNSSNVKIGGYMGAMTLKVDFTNYSKLSISGSGTNVTVGYGTSKYTSPNEEKDLASNVEFNISSLTGNYYISIFIPNQYYSATITEIKLVK